jgi:EAL domain-containing protein (putative c-di-GMP-specific phosphodiesterase class I)/ActR/RegA family two-component response regulator
MPGSAGLAQGRILVADDVPEILDIIGSLLGDAGYTVVTAPDGARALAELRSSRFDMVLTDIEMPDATGVDVLRAVRERDLDTPVVLITGNPTVQTAVKALELGAMRYLLKPIDPQVLLDVVSQGLLLRRLALLRREALQELGGMERLLADRAGLEAVFGRALEALYLDYQPIVRTKGGARFGHEALLRSREPALARPAAILDAAERLGRVHELSRRVRAQAAADLLRVPSRTVLVNLHPLDLEDPELLAHAAPLSAHAGLVILEITERGSLHGVGQLRDRVARLRALGYRIAVDDLGSGYAGLATFALLEPDLVKLDMSLIRDVDRHPLRRRLVDAMVELCRGLEIVLVAEGIETEAERTALAEAGCDLLQGFLIGRPGPLA